MNYRRLLWYVLGGMMVGFLLVHPFAMVANTLDPLHPHRALNLSLWLAQIRLAFSRAMLAMGVAFALIGGAAGFGLGAWHLQKERWMAEKLESQRRLAALETLRELMVTLAHHIRNANVVIGGFSSRLLKSTADAELQEQLRLVMEASRRIEAVVGALESLKEISTTHYSTAGQALMIDLKHELEARLDTKAINEQH